VEKPDLSTVYSFSNIHSITVKNLSYFFRSS